MTVDIENAFYSINHCFLIKVLEKYSFEKDFIKWTKISLQNQESYIVNRGTTKNQFKLEKYIRQGDPISTYLFILVLEIELLFTKENKKVNGLNMFDKTFLYTAYADDTIFVLNPIQDGLFRGCSRMGGGGQKGPTSLKSVTHILQR